MAARTRFASRTRGSRRSYVPAFGPLSDRTTISASVYVVVGRCGIGEAILRFAPRLADRSRVYGTLPPNYIPNTYHSATGDPVMPESTYVLHIRWFANPGALIHLYSATGRSDFRDAALASALSYIDHDTVLRHRNVDYPLLPFSFEPTWCDWDRIDPAFTTSSARGSAGAAGRSRSSTPTSGPATSGCCRFPTTRSISCAASGRRGLSWRVHVRRRRPQRAGLLRSLQERRGQVRGTPGDPLSQCARRLPIVAVHERRLDRRAVPAVEPELPRRPGQLPAEPPRRAHVRLSRRRSESGLAGDDRVGVRGHGVGVQAAVRVRPIGRRRATRHQCRWDRAATPWRASPPPRALPRRGWSVVFEMDYDPRIGAAAKSIVY